jgi:hypothetical protein
LVYPDGGLQDGFFGNFVCLQIQTDPLLQTVRLAFPAIFPDNQCLRPQGRSVTSTTAGKHIVRAVGDEEVWQKKART